MGQKGGTAFTHSAHLRTPNIAIAIRSFNGLTSNVQRQATTHCPQSLSLSLSSATRRTTRNSTSPLLLRRALSPASASTLLPRFHPASLGASAPPRLRPRRPRPWSLAVAARRLSPGLSLSNRACAPSPRALVWHHRPIRPACLPRK